MDINLDAISSSPHFTKLYTIPFVYYKLWLNKAGFSFTNKKVLDFGCGEGLTSVGLSMFCEVQSVTGVDISGDFLKIGSLLKEMGGNLSIPSNVNFNKTLPLGCLGEEKYDIVVSWSVIEHVAQNILEKQLDVIYKSLTPGGCLILQSAPLYYSSYGSHLYGIHAPWEHLTLQNNLLCELVYSHYANRNDAIKTWNTYRTLNKLTSWVLIDKLEQSNFKILETYETKDHNIPPDRLLSIYKENVLMNEQILLVCKK